MERFLIDTNVISDYFSASFSERGMALIGAAIDAIPNISIITQIELLCWDTDDATTEKVQNFIDDSRVFDINSDTINECVKLRKSKKTKLPDSIIAATALVHNLTILSRNTKDFQHIRGLNMIDPHDL